MENDQNSNNSINIKGMKLDEGISREEKIISEDENHPLLEEDNNRNINSKIKEKLLIDKIIDKTNFSKYKISSLFCMIFIFLSYGIELYLFNAIMLPMKEKFKLNNIFLGFINSALFLGTIFGSFFAGNLSKKFGRIKIININLITLTIFHLIMGIWLKIYIFIICRIVIGFSIGILVTLSINIYSEYLTSKNRGLFLMLLWSYGNIAQILQNLIAYFYLPKLENLKIEKYILMLFSFPLITTLICLIFLYDGPRYLILSNNNENLQLAVMILNNMNNNIELTSEEIDQIQIEVKSNLDSSNYILNWTITYLFNDFYLKNTLLLIIILFIASINYEGILIILPLVLKKLNEKLEKTSTEEKLLKGVILNQIIIGFYGTFANLIGGFISDIKIFGRKWSIMIFLLLTLITSIPVSFSILLFHIFSPIQLFSSEILCSLLMTYIVELYNSKIRDTSTGFFFMLDRLFDFISPFVYIKMINLNYQLPFFINASLCFVGAAVVYYLKYETAGKSLDTIN